MMVNVNMLADMCECVHINVWVSEGGLFKMWNSQNIPEKELIKGESTDLRSIQYFHF